MTSKDGDKLIRSGVWPFVREQGLWSAAARLVVGAGGFLLTGAASGRRPRTRRPYRARAAGIARYP